jgi:hypothetical protein
LPKKEEKRKKKGKERGKERLQSGISANLNGFIAVHGQACERFTDGRII